MYWPAQSAENNSLNMLDICLILVQFEQFSMNSQKSSLYFFCRTNEIELLGCIIGQWMMSVSHEKKKKNTFVDFQ